MTAPDTVTRDVMLRAVAAPDPESYSDWEAVLRRAGITPRRRRRRAPVLAFAVLALGLLALPATGVGTRLVDLFWEDGTPVDPSALDRQAREFLDVVGGDPTTVRQIASDGECAFYLLRNDDGMPCIVSGRADSRRRFGLGHCARDVLRLLPSADWPLYKEVSVALALPGDVRFVRVAGLVLPAITEVAFVDSAGKVVDEDDVVDHVFELSMAPAAPLETYAIVAYDDDGNEVHREPVSGRR